MAENSTIEWCDHTFNPWEGCQTTGSPACAHCYAEARNARFAPKPEDGGPRVAPNFGPRAPRRRTTASNWKKPLRWNGDAAAFRDKHGRKQRVFCASLGDVFDNAVPTEWRRDLFDLIEMTPDLDWLLLTKRIGNVEAQLADIGRRGLPLHVWLGSTIVTQAEANRDIPKLLKTPAAVRFLSMEPLHEAINLTSLSTMVFRGAEFLNALTGELSGMFGDPCLKRLPALDWIITGGESGRHAEPMHPDWARSLRDQCAGHSVPFLFKQWGEWIPADQWLGGTIPSGTSRPYDPEAPHDDNASWWRVGKKVAGRLLDGITHTEFPA